MLIALIDDGIDQERCSGIRISYDLIVDESGLIRERKTEDQVLTSHGTTCAQIIHTYESTAEFCSLRIFSSEMLKTSRKQLLAALQWCESHRVPIIHLSIGSTQVCDYIPIRDAVQRLLKRGQILIAAHSNNMERYTMPSCFSGVLGVASARSLSKDSYYIETRTGPSGIQLFASSRHDLSCYLGGYQETPLANSYSAPVITAHVHHLLRTERHLNTPFQILCRLAGRHVYVHPKRPDFLTEAIVLTEESISVLWERTIFCAKAIIKKKDLFLNAIYEDPNTPLLLLSGLEDLSFLEQVFYMSEQRRGILYAGILPQDFVDRVPCPIWDESYTFIPVKSCHGEIPIVQIQPNGKEAIVLAQKLEECLTGHGFCCVAVSDYPCAYLYGMEYVHNGNWVDTLMTLKQSYQPDIVLCVADDNTPFYCDMAVVIGDCGTQPNAEIVKFLPAEPTQANILEILYCLIEEK